MHAPLPSHPISALSAFDEEDRELLNAIVETPKGSRNKFDFDEKRGLIVLGGVLPAGAVFPFDFGFIPGTLGEDGDPLDVVVLTDEGAVAVPGCLVSVRLLGGIEAEQTEGEGEKPQRNDRLIGVMANSRQYQELRALDEVPGEIVADIEHFFRSYNQAKGKEFRSMNRCGPERARTLVEAGIRLREQEGR